MVNPIIIIPFDERQWKHIKEAMNAFRLNNFDSPCDKCLEIIKEIDEVLGK